MANLRKAHPVAWAAILFTAMMQFGGPVPARAASIAGGGVTLDGFGGLHPFGGFSLNAAGAALWGTWDIARALVVRPDGSGGWTLDGFGGIHAFGSAPATSTPAYWSGWDIARSMIFTSRGSDGFPDGRQGYLLDGFGGLHQWGGAPVLAGLPYTPNQDIWRGAEIHFNPSGVPDGGWEMDRTGRVVAFGAAPALSMSLPTAPIHQQLHLVGSGGYVVDKWGIVTAFGTGLSPNWNGYTDWGGRDIIRDIALVNPSNPTQQQQPVSADARAAYQAAVNRGGGVVLDGWGGLHQFGGVQLNTTRAPYWSRWDIARSLVVRSDGSGGWVLDGYGGIHAFGAAPATTSPAYWSGWDIARSMIFTSRGSDGFPDGRQGYLLDGFGGLHQWGGAPALAGLPYTPNQDIWRGAEIHYAASGVPDGGWEMDRWGHISAFGAAPTLSIGGLPNAPILQQLHTVGSGGFALTKWGQVITYGAGVSPYWSGYSDWGAWDILRDVALINPTNPTASSQPMSAAATSRITGATTLNYTMSVPLIAQSHNLDCESAALRMALLAKGVDRSENWILAQMGADLRRAVMDQFGDVLRWGDPYVTFVGNVNGLEYNGTGYGVYYPPIAMAAGRAGQWTLAKEGWNPHDLYVEAASGNPAVVWLPVYGYWQTAMRTWTAWDGRQIRYTLVEHAMTLIGVNAAAKTVTLNDPNRGFVRTVSMADFEAAFAKFNNMAVVVY